MSELEPVLLVEVVPVLGTPPTYAIEVGGVRLPVEYRGRSEALRIAERAYSLLVDGHEERWALMCERGVKLPPDSRLVWMGFTTVPCEDVPPGKVVAVNDRPRATADATEPSYRPGAVTDLLEQYETPLAEPVLPQRRPLVEGYVSGQFDRLPRPVRRCLCGHLRSQHSPAREDDYGCTVVSCGCNGWNPR